MRGRLLVVFPVVLLALAVAGCGGDKKNEEEESLKAPCKGPALSQPPALPADFPQPGELTYTKQQKAGPSLIVDGYWTAGIDEAYKEFKDQVEGAGYKILFDEHEEHDAEISYEASETSGQIALREDCTEDDTTRVHITNRPK
jgi:hypothetical protein